MENKRTTELRVLRKHPNQYTWGSIINIIDLDRYTFVLYRERKLNSDEITDNRLYTVYVDGIDRGLGAKSLEEAMILGIAATNPDNHQPHHAAMYACRLLGVKVPG